MVTLQQDDLRFEAEDAVQDRPIPELGEELAVEAAPEEVAPELPEAELPVCWIWSQHGARLTKGGGEAQEVGDGTLLPAYGWVPTGPGQVAVNLGEQGKWFIDLDQWVVYRREV